MAWKIHALPVIIRGDIWSQDLIVTKDGHDFTTPTSAVTSRMYLEGSTSVYNSFSLTPVFDSGVTHEFTVTLSLTKVQSTALTAGKYFGDVVVEQVGSFGPYTFAHFSVVVETRATPI